VVSVDIEITTPQTGLATLAATEGNIGSAGTAYDKIVVFFVTARDFHSNYHL
jgi:hypothetical protein